MCVGEEAESPQVIDGSKDDGRVRRSISISISLSTRTSMALVNTNISKGTRTRNGDECGKRPFLLCLIHTLALFSERPFSK